MQASAIKIPAGTQASPQQLSTNVVAGETFNFQHAKTERTALQILSFILAEPVEQFRLLLWGAKFRVGKKKTLDKVTIEEWGYANIKNHAGIS